VGGRVVTSAQWDEYKNKLRQIDKVDQDLRSDVWAPHRKALEIPERERTERDVKRIEEWNNEQARAQTLRDEALGMRNWLEQQAASGGKPATSGKTTKSGYTIKQVQPAQ